MQKRAWLKPLFKIAISLTLLVWLLSKVELSDLLKSLQNIGWLSFLLLYLAYLFVQFVSSWRWQVLAKDMGLKDTLVNAYRDYLVGIYYGLFVPTGIGGDVGRAYRITHRQQASYIKGILSTLAERFCGFAILMTIALVGLISTQPLYWQQLCVLFSGFFVLSFGVCFFMPWLQQLVHRWAQVKHLKGVDDPNEEAEMAKAAEVEPSKFSLKRWLLLSHHLDWPKPWSVSLGLLFSLVVHGLNTSLICYLVFKLSPQTQFIWWQMASVYAVMAAASMVPLSFSGIGIRENALVGLLMLWFAVPLHEATAISLAWLLVLLFAALPGGGIQLLESVLSLKQVTKPKGL